MPRRSVRRRVMARSAIRPNAGHPTADIGRSARIAVGTEERNSISGYVGAGVKIAGFREKLVPGEMMLVDDQRTDEPPGQFRMMVFGPSDELLHFAARPCAGAENQNMAGGLQRLRHRRKKAVGVRFFLSSRSFLRVMGMAKVVFRLLRKDLLRDGAAHFRAKDTGLVVINNEEPMCILIRRRRYRLRSLEKMAQGHDLVRFGDIFRPRRMQDQGLPVARDLEVAVGFLIDLTELAKHGVDVVPSKIMRDRMLEDGFVGAQMRASKGRGCIHSCRGKIIQSRSAVSARGRAGFPRGVLRE